MNLPHRQPKIQPVNPPHESANRRKPAPAPSADALAERAARALGDGRSEEAVKLLREALKLSPMRGDLRDALSAALERRAGVGSAAAPVQVPVVGRGRRSLLGERPMMPEEAPQIEEIRFRKDDRDRYADDSDEIESELPAPRAARPDARPSRDTPPPIPARRAAPPRPEFRRRPKKSPLSRWALLILFGLLGVAFVAGGAIYLIASGSEASRTKAAAREAAAEDQRWIAEADDDLRQNRYSLAVEKLERLSPGAKREELLAKTFAKQGDDFSREKKYTEARQAYESALEHDPSDARLAVDLGMCYYMLGRKQQGGDRKIILEMLSKAERQFRTALEIDAANARALEGLAKIEIARGNSAGAAVHYRKIIELDPGSPEADSAKKNLEMMRLKP